MKSTSATEKLFNSFVELNRGKDVKSVLQDLVSIANSTDRHRDMVELRIGLEMALAVVEGKRMDFTKLGSELPRTLPDISFGSKKGEARRAVLVRYSCGHDASAVPIPNGMKIPDPCPLCKVGRPEKIVTLSTNLIYDRGKQGEDYKEAVTDFLTPKTIKYAVLYECGCEAQASVFDGDYSEDDFPDFCPVHNKELVGVREVVNKK